MTASNQTSPTKIRPNVRLLAIGGAFLLPPGWVVFDGMRNLAGMPTWLALFTVGSLAVITICLIFQGLRNLGTGDLKDAQVQFVAAGAIIAAEFVGQWWFALTESHALVTALIMSMLSVGGALIIEGEIMHVWRSNARRDGQMALARARVPREVAKAYPLVGAIFDRLAIRYPNATQRSILDRAFAEHDAAQATEQRRELTQQRVDLAELTGQSKVTAAKPARTRPAAKPEPAAEQSDPAEQTVTATVTSLPSARAAELLDVARELRADFREDHEGRDLNRDQLAAAVRGTGTACPTDVAGELLRLLRAEDDPQAAANG